MASYISQPFKATYRFAYDRPAYFWSLVIGFAGPVYVLVMPPILKKFGHVKPEAIPYTYPSKSQYMAVIFVNFRVDHMQLVSQYNLGSRYFIYVVILVPNRPRRPTVGYEDP
ncbi:319_t:CDS:2 [Ambispora gerdemannii]|uniref:319_t:CDS:1 n=1 Tax=Ambispora gerdemannii TaxID=144530 RepID=A0A9N9EZ99_9GLOM|nr:319_t:CDS:2 [Ambispora gerdemannii]